MNLGPDVGSSRRSSSESGFSEEQQPVSMPRARFKDEADSLGYDMEKLQLRRTGDMLPTQQKMYSYQWDQPRFFADSFYTTTRLSEKTAMPFFPAGGNNFDSTALLSEEPRQKSVISPPAKSIEDWLKVRLQQDVVDQIYYNPTVTLSTPRNLHPQDLGSDAVPKRLHVSNIPFRYRELNLYNMFNQFGMVEDVEIIYNDKGSKGFGFVTMSRAGDADRAQASLHGSTVEGRVIEVNLATKKMVPSSRSRPPAISTLPPYPSYQYNCPFVSARTFSPTSQQASSIAFLEAQTRLAKAQLDLLVIQQQFVHTQYKVDKPAAELKREVMGNWSDYQQK